jgi:hypothetical protein
MANPRADVRFTEVLLKSLTFLRKKTSTGAIDFLWSPTNPYPVAKSTQIGFSAAIDSARTAKYGAAGDTLLGQVADADTDTVVINVQGGLTFSFTNDANAPVLGRGVVCDGSGGVRIAASGSEWKERGIVVDLDTTALTAVVLLIGN